MITGYTTIEALPFLRGLPLDDLAYAYIRALRPSKVRVSTGLLTSDAVCWRVTVLTDDDGIISSIFQEVEVDLRGGFAHGHALDCEMRLRVAALEDA